MEDVRRYRNEVQCKTCYDVIWKVTETSLYVNGICLLCRQHIPYYLSEDQHVRFLLARRKARKKWLIDG